MYEKSIKVAKIGAWLMLIGAVLLFAFAAMLSNPSPEIMNPDADPVEPHFESVSIGNMMSGWAAIAGLIFLVPAILGFVSTSIIDEKPKTARILMIIAAVFCLATLIGFIPFILFLVAEEIVLDVEKELSKKKKTINNKQAEE